MNAKLEFNLPDDQYEFDLACKASALSSALWSIGQELRRLEKYEQLTEDQYKLIGKLREFYYAEVNAKDIAGILEA